jgi:glycosyltransferase involved in cell wall biosynthesis
LRVLLVTDWLRASGGMERYFETLRTGFRDAGHDVRLLTSTAGTAAEGTAEYRAIGSNSTAVQVALQLVNPFAFARIKSVVREFRPELAVVGMIEQHLSPIALFALDGVPTILSVGDYKPICPIHSKFLPTDEICEVPAGLVCWQNRCTGLGQWLRDRPRYSLLRSAFARADHVLTCSSWLQRALRDEGFETEAMLLPAARVSPGYVRTPAPQPVFVFVGRLSREKGVHTLIRAFARTRDSMPDAQLSIAGDGEQRPELERLAASLGLGGAVAFLGALPLPEVEQQLGSAWASVAPSLWAEPLGLVAVEAIVRGVPVIASSRGGLAEVVEHGRSGLLVPNGDEIALARCLEDVGAGRAFGDRGLPADVVEAARERHDLERHVARIAEIHREIRSRRTRGERRMSSGTL